MAQNCGQDTCVTGQINFKQKESGGPTLMSGLLRGVLPIGQHGWHVHEFGIRNTTEGCGSTGGHFNPLNMTHGAPDAEVRHVGDLGNFESKGASGWAFLKQSDDLISLVGEEDESVVGRTLVIHGGVDDLGGGTGELMESSLANGNAGPRIGCCEIKLKL
ncbi:hypothetical protein BSKO_04627 [Bryopsis sp. KO-2023]|nr:hypothetical protein BSKO_04627 [Bryopsis sp. KO-2023]